MGATAWVRVLDDRDRRRVELGHELPGGVQIHEIVVGQFLPVQLAGAAYAVTARAVQRRLLVRVLSVAQQLAAGNSQVEDLGQRVLRHGRRELADIQARQHVRDRAVVGGGQFEGLAREIPVRALRELAGRLQFLAERGVVGGIGDDGNIAEVLRGRPDQRGSADVDVLDELVERGSVAGGGFLERVQVHDDHVDRRDPVIFQGTAMVGIRAYGQDASGDVRMQGLDPSV